MTTNPDAEPTEAHAPPAHPTAGDEGPLTMWPNGNVTGGRFNDNQANAERLTEVLERYGRPDEKDIGSLPRGGASLSYVGHAAITRMLIEVDPFWSWEPMAIDSDGGPLIRYGAKDAELWIRLTVLGKTLPAVGTDGIGKDDLAKKLISDALRNGAMRFGFALSLWSKEEWDVATTSPSGPPSGPWGVVKQAKFAVLGLVQTAEPAMGDDDHREVAGEVWSRLVNPNDARGPDDEVEWAEAANWFGENGQPGLADILVRNVLDEHAALRAVEMDGTES